MDCDATGRPTGSVLKNQQHDNSSSAERLETSHSSTDALETPDEVH